MSPRKSREKKVSEPVLLDQGGRLMPVDPIGSINAPLEELVRRKAYELYEQRGGMEGHALEDWVNAESHVRRVLKTE